MARVLGIRVCWRQAASGTGVVSLSLDAASFRPNTADGADF